MKITADGARKREQKRRDAQRARRLDFEAEADPLFFKWQRGEATREQYESKVAEIRARHPYPEE